MGLQTELQEKINAQMKEWNEGLQELKEKIRVLRVKADKVEDHIKTTYQTTLTNLEKKVEVLQNRIEDGKQECHKFIQASGEARKEVTSGVETAWDNVKKGVETAWADLKSALDHASRKFK